MEVSASQRGIWQIWNYFISFLKIENSAKIHFWSLKRYLDSGQEIRRDLSYIYQTIDDIGYFFTNQKTFIQNYTAIGLEITPSLLKFKWLIAFFPKEHLSILERHTVSLMTCSTAVAERVGGNTPLSQSLRTSLWLLTTVVWLESVYLSNDT